MPATNPLLIHVGRGEIFIDVPLPQAGVPVRLNVDGTPFPGGRYVGSTLDAASFIYRPTTFDIKTQQATGNVGYVTIEEDLRLEFTIGELSYENIRDTTLSRLDQGSGISFGGVIFPITKAVLLVAPRRAGGFQQAMIYQAIFSEERTFQFSRTGHLALKVVARALALTFRTEGDQLGHYFPNVQPQ